MVYMLFLSRQKLLKVEDIITERNASFFSLFLVSFFLSDTPGVVFKAFSMLKNDWAFGALKSKISDLNFYGYVLKG